MTSAPERPSRHGSARFWDRIAERYARRPVADEAAYRRKLAITREYLGPEMEVLELGSGTGSTAIAHAPYVRHLRAVDISAKMTAIARAKAAAAGVANVSFERSAIEDLDGAEGAYDAVMAHSLLHLVADREAAIARVHSMLKPGGVFVSSTACLGDFARIFRLIAPIGRLLGVIPLVRVFTGKELEASLGAAGFTLVRRWQPARNAALFIVARKALA